MSKHLYRTTDYRRFLREELKRQGRTSAQLGDAMSRSKAYVSLVLSGARKLDPDVVPAVAKLLELDESDRLYLAALVDLESPSKRARNHAVAVVQARRKHHEVSDDFDDSGASLYERWYVPVVFELVRCDGFRADPQWIADTVYPPITVEQAADAITLLRHLERVEDDGEGGLRQRAPEQWSPVDLPPGRATELGLEAHRATLALAAEGLDEFRYNERYVAGVTTAINEERYEAVMGRLKEMMLELVHMADDAAEPANRVFHLGVQLFPMSNYSDTEADPRSDDPDEPDED